MPLYCICRNIGPMTREHLDAAVFRATVCAAEYEGLHWVRSFWNPDQGQILCFYMALNVEQVRQHSHQSAIPCDEINEVTEVCPDVYSPAVASRS